MMTGRATDVPTYAVDVWLAGAHLGRGFLEAGDVWRPLSLGHLGDLMVSGEGVLPTHAWIGGRRGVVYAVSADEATPALLFEQPVAVTWTRLPVPCLLRLGAAIVKVSRLPASGRPSMPRAAGQDETEEEPTLRRLSTPRTPAARASLEDAPTITAVGVPSSSAAVRSPR